MQICLTGVNKKKKTAQLQLKKFHDSCVMECVCPSALSKNVSCVTGFFKVCSLRSAAFHQQSVCVSL